MVTNAQAAGKPIITVRYAWTLSAMMSLHLQTGDARLLTWARDDMLALVATGRQPGAPPKPLFASFRFLPPFCETYLYLRKHHLFTAAEVADIAAQISASVATHHDYTDFGTHNRALIDGAAFYYAAAAMPDGPEAAPWRAYGESLAARQLERLVDRGCVHLPAVLADLHARARGPARSHAAAHEGR